MKKTAEKETKETAEKLAEREQNLTDGQKLEEIKDNEHLEEISKGYRLVKNTRWGDIRIYRKDKMAIDKVGSDYYSRERFACLKDKDVPSYKELFNEYKERAIWSDADEQEIETIKNQISDLLISKQKTEDDDEKNKKDLKMSELYGQLEALLTIKRSLFGDCIEERALYKQELGWLIAATVKDNGSTDYDPKLKLFKTVDELENQLVREDILFLIKEAKNFWMGVELGEGFFGELQEGQTSDSDGGSPSKSENPSLQTDVQPQNTETINQL